MSAIGHGGGGMQAMLLAMRNRGVSALVNIDMEQLRRAGGVDPAATIYQPENLSRIVTRAITNGDLTLAEAVVLFALELHADSPLLVELHSKVLEARGDVRQALERASACAAMQAGSSWRAGVAINACRERMERLTARRRPRVERACRCSLNAPPCATREPASGYDSVALH